MEKICTNCEGKDKHSEDWTLTKELAKNNKRMFVILIVVLCMWLATTGAFIWYLNQYDVVEETITVDTQTGGDAYYSEVTGDGTINYGTDTSEKAETAQKE